jgi:hypothetical protein
MVATILFYDRKQTNTLHRTIIEGQKSKQYSWDLAEQINKVAFYMVIILK